METQGSQIFDKLSSLLNPKQLKKVLHEKHRAKMETSKKDKSKKIMILHPSPRSFGCIDMVFGITNDWSPFFNENVSVYLNRLTQLLVKGIIINCLFEICETFSIIAIHENILEKILEKCGENKDDIDIMRAKYIRNISKQYVQRFSELNIYKTLIKVRESFEKCIRWYIALGFVPIQMFNDNSLKRDTCQWALKLLEKKKNNSDDIQQHIVIFFAVLEYSLKKYEILSPVDLKHHVIITSLEGWYNATTYGDEYVELLSFDKIQADCTSCRMSLAESMLSHEYLYLFAHDTNAIQTTQKLCQSTIVVSSEPAFSINTNKTATDDKKNSFNWGLASLQELQTLYQQMSDECKKKLEYNPTNITMLNSQLPDKNQIKVLKNMHEQLNNKSLKDPLISTGGESQESELSSNSINLIMDLQDDPKRNLQQSIKTVQHLGKMSHLQQMERDLNGCLKTIEHLQSNITKYIEKNAIDNLTISILKLEKDEDKNSMKNIQKELDKVTKINDDLVTRVDNMVGVIKDLTSRVNISQEQNDEFLNMIIKGKSLTDQSTDSRLDLAWTMTSEKRTEIISLFLTMLNIGTEKDFIDDQFPKDLSHQYEDVLIKLKMEIVPLFHKVRNRHQLNLCNSWVPDHLKDKCTSFKDLADSKVKIHDNDIIEIYETTSLKVIDVNPISKEEQERVKKIAESTQHGTVIGATGAGGSLFTKKFFNIQFPQTGNVEGAIDKGLRERWSQTIKTMFMLSPPEYTITGQEMLPAPSQGTYEKFIIPYLTMTMGSDQYVRETVALLMKMENKQMFEQGAKDVNTFFFDDIFYFFWDNMI
jgi:hypothetical protein